MKSCKTGAAGALLVLVLALLLCAGCGHRPAANTTPVSSASTPDHSSDAAPTQSQPTPEPDVDPVTRLNALSPDSFPSLGAIDGGKVLVCWTDYGNATEEAVTYCDLLDAEQDKVLRSTSLSGALTLMRTFSDGTALLFGYEREQFFLLDEALHTTPLDVPVIGGQFSGDHSRYYFVENELLYVYDLASRKQTQLPLAQGIRLSGISGIHPTEHYLMGWVYPSLYSLDTCSALIDCDSGTLILLQQGLSSPSFFGDAFQGRVSDYTTLQEHWVWGDLTSEEALCCISLSDLEDEFTVFQPLADSNYALQVRDASWWEEAAGPDSQNTTLFRLEQDGLSLCVLKEYGLNGALNSSVYLPEEHLILGCTYQPDQPQSCQIYRINPDALEFSEAGIPLEEPPARIDQLLWENCLAELQSPELSSDLKGVRDRADQLEQRFGVHILLSAECADPCTASDYYVTTTDQAGWKNEALSISRALNGVEQALSNYPDGFFRQFRTESQDSGIYFMLVGPIGSDDPINVAAFEYGSGPREYIGLDISFYELTGNLYHEIWHATENKIFNTTFSGFYDGSWEQCNPEGFEYRYEYNLSDPEGNLWRWTFTGGDSEYYFVDDYAKTYPKEDRARIMEYVMGDDGLAQSLLTSPAIQQKLRLMDQGIRAAFDTTGWEDVRWMRFF